MFFQLQGPRFGNHDDGDVGSAVPTSGACVVFVAVAHESVEGSSCPDEVVGAVTIVTSRLGNGSVPAPVSGMPSGTSSPMEEDTISTVPLDFLGPGAEELENTGSPR